MLEDYLKIAVRNIAHRRMRSWLTAIGIIIGVASIVALISISQGMQVAVEEQFEQLGSDTINIMPKGFQGPGSSASDNFDDSDVDTIEDIPEVESVYPMVYGTSEVEFHNQKRYPYVSGVPMDKEAEKMWDEIGFEVKEGRFPEEGKKEVGIGALVEEDLFDDEIHVKNRIKINGEKFKVVGIAEEVGNQQDDSSVFMDIEVAQEILNMDGYIFMMAIVKEGVDPNKVVGTIERKLENHKDSENFNVMTPADILEQVNQILGIIQLVLVGIAAISLLVGAIGIMNTMYTSVLERTKEIGIMKAIGATNHAIMTIFLIEAGILGIVGGTIGATLGVGMGKVVELASKGSGFFVPLQVHISPELILGAIGFAFIVGAISGTLPALKAAKLKPTDALRYE